MPGTRIRIDAPSVLPSRLVGTLLAVRFDTLEVKGNIKASRGKQSEWTDPIPLSVIDNLERSRGTKGHGLVGMGLGLLAGVATAHVVSSSSGEYRGLAFLTSGVLFAVGGAVLGGMLGAQFRTEQWENVSVGMVETDPVPEPRLIPGSLSGG